MSELLQLLPFVITGVTSFSGIVGGYFVVQYLQGKRETKRKTTAADAVSNELSIISDSLNDNKKHGENYTIKEESHPFVCDAYDCLKIELASWLKPEALANLNKAYARIKELNSKRDNNTPRGYVSISNSNSDYSICFTHDITDDIKKIEEAINHLKAQIP